MENSTFRTDGVTLGILRSRFVAVAESMCHTLERTAYSTFIKESADYACGLVSPDGEIFAYPRHLGVTSFVGLNLGTAIAHVGDCVKGDVVITNDPYTTDGLANHLPDIHMFAPIVIDGEIIAYSWCFIHSSDVGGDVPGSISPDFSTVEQEGHRMAPAKIMRAGEVDRELVDGFLNASRIPEDNWGDLQAMIAALGTGRRQLVELTQRYGVKEIGNAVTDVLHWSELGMESALLEIPDGEYRFADFLDGDEVGNPIRLEVALRIESNRAVLDFHGTDPQVGNAFNLPAFGPRHPFLSQALLNFVLTHHTDIPMTGGLMRPLTNVTEPGSILCPEYPAAVGVRYGTAHRLYNVVMGALAQAVPDMVPSAGAGQAAIVALSVPRSSGEGRTVSVLEPMFGGGGATTSGDGVAGADSCAGYLKNTPVESMELKVPVIAHSYHLTPDSAGAGLQRGGWGVGFEFEVLKDDSIVTARGMERTRFRPWGVRGGTSGSLTSADVTRDGVKERLDGRIGVLSLQQGDRVLIEASGAGGSGEPLDRAVELVAQDVREELLSPDNALRDYGVVLDDELVVDEEKTAEARAVRAKSIQDEDDGVGFDFGPERNGHDRLWPASARKVLRTAFSRVDPQRRQDVKRRAYELVGRRGSPLVDGDLPTVLGE
jgi:N-methylhydantoinase B